MNVEKTMAYLTIIQFAEDNNYIAMETAFKILRIMHAALACNDCNSDAAP